MFYVAYFKKDAKAEERPITFFYNGGPGSSTVWLHMGSLGPKHVVTDTDTHLPAAPYKMVDNVNSLLDVSDLVFIDMPGTGFGRLLGKEPEKAFWGIDEDANAFARFIVRFTTKYNRWNSPKYIFGESYGTTRSAVLADIADFQLHHGHRHTVGESGSGLAVRAGVADLCGDGVVPQETAYAAGGAGAVSERGGGVCQRAVCPCTGAGHRHRR
jgi:carboxypeptidase C (cathepsin A)